MYDVTIIGCGVTGGSCEKGISYGIEEIRFLKRILTSTVKAEGSSVWRCPVKTGEAIPKSKIFEVMAEIDRTVAYAPVKVGDVVCENVTGTGVDIVATRDVEAE